MPQPSIERALERAHARATEFLAGVGERPVSAPVDLGALRAAFGGALPAAGADPADVVEEMARAADPGLVATAGPRYFGFVIGGSLPAALGADWLASTWDQNAAMAVMSPAAAVVEEVVGDWLVDLFGLPSGTSFGFTTGATMANFAALGAARHRVLADAGWDVEAHGLVGAPAPTVRLGAEAHATVPAALGLLGLGRERVVRVEADGQGRMRPDALASALASIAGPLIVCAQAGNVNTGAFDPLEAIAGLVRDHGGWLHVDGAFGMWAALTRGRRHLTAGMALADSWTTDCHKWLNVPYDSGLVFVRDAAAHHDSMSMGAPYYIEGGGVRDGFDWVPDSSRRARGFAVWAALRQLGRDGLDAAIDRSCVLAARLAAGLAGEPGLRVLNDVVLNQVLVRIEADDGDPAISDAVTRDAIARVQRDGTCWLGGTTWRAMAAMRLSISNLATTEDDIDRSVEAILRCVREARAAAASRS